MPHESVARVRRAVGEALSALPAGAVLAVSGGIDSAVLLDAAMAVAPGRVRAVATFDHGTGAHAARAADHVAAAAARLGVACHRGVGSGGRTEAGWRRERWAFLRQVAAGYRGAAVAVAHTADDQVETVVMRVLRGAGARGLAGLAARQAGVVRPLLGLRRADVAAYARAAGVVWVDDPSNRSPAHLRNRVRHDLLPAIARVRPGFAGEMLALGERAAAWRAATERLAAAVSEGGGAGRPVRVTAAALDGLSLAELAVLWPAVAARAGVVLDRRGTARAAGFTMDGRGRGVVPLSGGARLVRSGDRFVLRPAAATISTVGPPAALPSMAAGALTWGRFRFRAGPAGGDAADCWVAEFDVDASLTVRAWVPGDRMRWGSGERARRVKRFLADRRVPAHEREGWPVVVADGAIVWIPGVRRSDAATVRPGRPGVRYECDRIDG